MKNKILLFLVTILCAFGKTNAQCSGTGPIALCSGDAFTLNGSPITGTWFVSSTSGTAAPTSLTTIGGIGSGAVTGSGSITFVFVDGACSTYVNTVVNPLPVITGPTSTCTGLTINLSTGTSGIWTPTSSFIAYATGSVITGVAAGTQTISFMDAGTGCVGTTVITVTPATSQYWTAGASNNDWDDAGNWACGHVPTTTEDVSIGATMFDPVVGFGTPTVAYCHNLTMITSGAPPILTISPSTSTSTLKVEGNLTMQANTSINMATLTLLKVRGDIDITGTIIGDGVCVIDGPSSPQQISAHGTGPTMSTISNIDILTSVKINTSGCDPLGVTGSVTFPTTSTATLTTNDYLTLVSDINGTGRIGEVPSTVTISGKVTCQQYIPGGHRAWRFFGHPFNADLSGGLQQIITSSGVDISGPTPTVNCFVPSSTNAATAYYYKTLSSNSLVPNDPGWTAYASACGTTGNEYKQYQGIRVLVRGAPGEGLGSGSYTPSATTYSMYGNVNVGDQYVPLLSSTLTATSTFTNFSIPSIGYSDYKQTYNCISNPYPSPVDIAAVLAPNYTGPTAQYSHTTSAADLLYTTFFWVFQPNMGTSGQYLPLSFNGSASPYYGSFIIPANTMFQVRANPIYSLTPTLVFHEYDKRVTPTTPTSGGPLLRGASKGYTVLTVMGPNDNTWDIIKLRFDDESTGNEDAYDASKLMGYDYNLFTVAEDNHPLSYDHRPFKENQSIILGMNGVTSEHLTIKVSSMAVPEGKALYLYDRVMGKYELLKQDMEYPFYFDATSTTEGDRFHLVMKPATGTTTLNNLGITANISPNPTNGDVNVSFLGSQTEHTFVTIMDVTGRVISTNDAGVKMNGNVKLDLHSLTAGVYIVEVSCGKDKIIEKLIKE